MPVPPPPPPPPPTAIKSIIPGSNMQLLESIEKGTKLKAVPDSFIHDRSSNLQATNETVPLSHAGSRQSITPVPNIMQKPILNNGSNDFHNELINQLSAMRSGGSNNFHEKRISVPNQPVYKAVPNIPSTINRASPEDNMPSYNERGISSFIPYSQSPSVKSMATPTLSASNKPPVSKPFQSQFSTTSRPIAVIPTAIAPKPMMSTPEQSVNNWNSVSNQNVTNNPWPPSINQSQPYNGRAPPPNQFQGNSNRAPPPPPSKYKPIHRDSLNMELAGPQCPTEPALRPRPMPPPSSSYSPPPTVTRTTGNPPPPVPNFRYPTQRPQSSSSFSSTSSPASNPPSLPSRALSGQYSISSTSIPSKILDRAPPPPPPSSMQRQSITSHVSLFDRKFTFPDERQFPDLCRY